MPPPIIRDLCHKRRLKRKIRATPTKFQKFFVGEYLIRQKMFEILLENIRCDKIFLKFCRRIFDPTKKFRNFVGVEHCEIALRAFPSKLKRHTAPKISKGTIKLAPKINKSTHKNGILYKHV